MDDARRLVALPAGKGEVSLSWRLLGRDEKGAGFEIQRDAGKGWAALAGTQQNHLLDEKADGVVRYRVRAEGETEWSESLPLSASERSNIAVEFPLSYPAKSYLKWTFGDSGDGRGVFVFTSQAGPTIVAECYSLLGRKLWDYQTNIPSSGGWDGGINHVPIIVWDINRDGRAEVILHGRPEPVADWEFYEQASDGEILAALDWETGEEVWRAPWPAKEARVMMTAGYLRGLDEVPCVVVQDGTYPRTGVGLHAFKGEDGSSVWSVHQDEGGGHNLDIADIDLCGTQEVIAGGVCYKGDGSVKWKSGITGHTDISKPCPLRDDVDGLQIFYAIETKPSFACLVDAEGRTLWREDFEHAHFGWIASHVEGLQPHVADKPKTGFNPVYLPDGSHLLILVHNQARRFEPIHWSGDGLANMVRRDSKRIIRMHPDGSESEVEGGELPDGGRYCRNNLMMDILGDYREEIASFDDERDVFFVASNPLPPPRVEASPFSDFSYRHDRSQHGSGYYIYISPPEWAR